MGEFKNFGPKDVQNFHLRNLFFRIQKMISLGAEPVFVLDGKAPERKLQTIAARLGQKNVVSGERRQLVRLFKPCCDLFDSLGIMVSDISTHSKLNLIFEKNLRSEIFNFFMILVDSSAIRS